jgi:hypothetical protein
MIESKIHRKNQRKSIFLVSIIIIVSTISWILFLFNSAGDNYSLGKFDKLRTLFSKTVTLAHTQWMFENRPDIQKMVGFQVLGSDIKDISFEIYDNVLVEMNRRVWPSLRHSCRSELTRQGISLP